MKNLTVILLETECHESLFAEILRTHFLSKLIRHFSVIEFLSKNAEDLGSVFFKISTVHMTTLPAGLIGCIDIPITL